MAYPTAEEILGTLPGGGQGIEIPEIEEYIEQWLHLLRQGSSAEPPENDLGRSIVQRGARADSLELQYTRQGYAQVPAAEAMRRDAYRRLERFEREVSLPGETSTPAASEPDLVSNFTEEPLWDHERYPDTGSPRTSLTDDERRRW